MSGSYDPFERYEYFRDRRLQAEMFEAEALKPKPHHKYFDAAIADPNASNLLELGKVTAQAQFGFWLALMQHDLDRATMVSKAKSPPPDCDHHLGMSRLMRFAIQQDRRNLEVDLQRLTRLLEFSVPELITRARHLFDVMIVDKAYPATPQVRRKEITDLGLPYLDSRRLSEKVQRGEVEMKDKSPETIHYYARYKHRDRRVQFQILTGLMKNLGPPPDFSEKDMEPPAHD